MHTDISQTFSHSCTSKHTKGKKTKLMSHCVVSDIFVYVHDQYACSFSFFSAYCSRRPTSIFKIIERKKKRVEWAFYAAQHPFLSQRSINEMTSTKIALMILSIMPEVKPRSSKIICQSSSGVIQPISPGCPGF